MRPEKAYRKVSLAIRKCIDSGSFEFLRTVVNELNKLLEKSKEEDYEPVMCSYDYDVWNLSYISDRFNSSSRLMWLIHCAETNPAMGTSFICHNVERNA